MNVRVLLAAFAGAVTAFLLGWLVYGMLLGNFFMNNTLKVEGLWIDPPNLVGIFLSGFSMSFLIAWIFSRWANISTFVTGFTTGAFIAFFILLSYDLYFWSATHLYSAKFLALDVVMGTVFNGLVSGVVALVLGMKKEA